MSISEYGCYLLAAGEGTRLKPLTDSWPKCLMPINGNPLIEFWISACAELFHKPILVNTKYLADLVGLHLRPRKNEGLVKIIHEETLLGTAGSLRVAGELYKQKGFFVAHADNYSDINLNEFFQFHLQSKEMGIPISMAVFYPNDPTRCGVVLKDKNNIVTKFYEKVKKPPSNLANAALYFFEPEVFEWLRSNPEAKDISVDLIPAFLGRIRCFEHSGVHRDIGTVEDLMAAQAETVAKPLWPRSDWGNPPGLDDIIAEVKGRVKNVHKQRD
jgi:mannose-1-phosphate guanylyltransferase